MFWAGKRHPDPIAETGVSVMTDIRVKRWYICGTFLWYIHEICTKDNVLNRN